MAIVIELELAERRRIAAIEVLPGEEERTRFVAHGEVHCLEGSEVIWLLVNVDHFRACVAHDRAKLRIVVQVKIAIERHRRLYHVVAASVEPFEYLLTAVVALPVRRGDDS